MENKRSLAPESVPQGRVSRRDFIRTAAITGASAMIVPRHVLGQGMTPPSDTVNIATVGVAGMGASNTTAVLSQNIAAFCDCDFRLLDDRLDQWRRSANPPPDPLRPSAAGTPPAAPPASAWTDFGRSKAQETANAKWQLQPQADLLRRFVSERMDRVPRYRDYREMLEKQKDIDGVIIATPDHMHAVIASAAMDLGKHVYVQKPLCWSVQEARHLAKRASETKVVTQMGNQGHSQDGARRGQDYIQAGAIGDIQEVHVWTNRPLGYWPQGVPRPAPLSDPGVTQRWNNAALTSRLAASMYVDFPPPDTLSWDLFLGVAPDVHYHPIYHPFNWRGWVDWGQGALGDMGAHLIDHPVWGLELGLPTSIETISTPFNGLSFPDATTTYYEFAARSGRPAVKMIWYDGGLLPPRPEELGEEKLNPTGGVLYVGSRGKMLQDTYGARPRLLPAERHNQFGAPPERLERVPHESHEMNWVNAIRKNEPISCPFSYASHLTEIMLLGMVSLRANTKLHYDGAAGRVTNNERANQFLTREYRKGYSL